ncbi:MAG: hypothetical protein KC776_43755 [Myxococcales bacterium]|nr:hypothetical protein [Myxococcales bacterium]MCB9576449.1 hypothetical protein [Polyangiaceae bacterium]
MLLKRVFATGLCSLGLAALILPGCGAKSGLREGLSDAGADGADGSDGGDGAVGPECVDVSDCNTEDLCQPERCLDGHCVASEPKNCDDGDECTGDSCNPATGECESTPLTLDQDGDGFRGPRPGFAAGAPGSCGDDCDDTSAKAFPGNPEVCDGVDNDCDGIIDNDMKYVPFGPESIRVSATDLLQAGHGGIAFNGELYAAAYAGQKSAWRSYVKGLNPDGSTAFGTEPITNIPSDTFTGPIVWTGAEFGTAWEDRRDNDYEIYFNRVDALGKKLGPDLRITNAPGFSLHPAVVWNGTEFMLAWDDRRNGPSDYRIYGQRVSVKGDLIGENVELTGKFSGAESPSMAEGEKTIAIAFNMGDSIGKKIGFRAFGPDFGSPQDLVVLSTDNGVNPSIVWNKDRYVVVYGKRDAVPGPAIWGVVVDESGKVLVQEKQITFGASFARTQAILPLGDRLLLVWADDKDGNYELYSKMLSPSLQELTPRQRITKDPSDSVYPSIAFGPDGDVGVLFDDRRTGNWQVYFSRLVCSAGN